MSAPALVPRPRSLTGSWLGLLAATTLGGAAATVNAEVQAEGLPASGSYRLVVQSYDARDGRLPGPRSRPVASTQREVTAEELRRGIRVSLLELRDDATDHGPSTVVAWLESGGPELEFDGRRARPAPGSVYGMRARRADEGTVQVRLDRRVAA